MVIHKGEDTKTPIKLSASLVIKTMISRAIMRFCSDGQLSKKLILLNVIQSL